MNEIDLNPEVEEQALLLEEDLKNLPDKHVNMNAGASRRTICSVLRDICHKTEDEEIKNGVLKQQLKLKK